MDSMPCFGSLQERTRTDGLTTIETGPDCRSCPQMLECLREAKKRAEAKCEKEEVKKQERIARILDLSQVVSNEVGSSLLQFLNRIYHSSLGSILFQNLLLFFEVTEKGPSFSLTLPISSSILELISEDEAQEKKRSDSEGHPGRLPRPKEVTLRMIFIKAHFSGNSQATMGLIAREVIRTLTSERDGLAKISRLLPEEEARRLRTMLPEPQVKWLMERWGFGEEEKAFERALRA